MDCVSLKIIINKVIELCVKNIHTITCKERLLFFSAQIHIHTHIHTYTHIYIWVGGCGYDEKERQLGRRIMMNKMFILIC